MLFKLLFPLFTLFKENGMIKDNHMLNQSDGEQQMKVLVTGFDPFGGDKVNPAYEAVKNAR